MQAALQKLFQGARDGLTDTKVELGNLLSLSPLSVKLDEDPAPLEENELVRLNPTAWRPEDVGKKVAVIRCTNGQYLLLGVVG
ncbi:hypothetical protein [Brevibacillus borstelensis]|uniref:hypothetical protein n=2 Tax=Brevibacillus borstelensis TaxID=45462 RepID=UPI0004F2D698|nr:hypothetical protein [Brevibacillus borstelensis]KKX56338.1 hypothetical protein X546_04420 [Brevibacillus borstelensis cifa_chp40]